MENDSSIRIGVIGVGHLGEFHLKKLFEISDISISGIYDIDYFQILSYYTFLWSEFLEDTEKEEEVLFRRINIPKIEVPPDGSLVAPATPEESR